MIIVKPQNLSLGDASFLDNLVIKYPLINIHYSGDKKGIVTNNFLTLILIKTILMLRNWYIKVLPKEGLLLFTILHILINISKNKLINII